MGAPLIPLAAAAAPGLMSFLTSAGGAGLIGGVFNAIGGLFRKDPAKQQFKYQKELEQWRLEQEKKKPPFRSAIMTNPYFKGALKGQQMGYGPVNFEAMQQGGMLSPYMATMINALRPPRNPLPNYQPPNVPMPGKPVDRIDMLRNILARGGRQT